MVVAGHLIDYDFMVVAGSSRLIRQIGSNAANGTLRMTVASVIDIMVNHAAGGRVDSDKPKDLSVT